jgi:transposase
MAVAAELLEPIVKRMLALVLTSKVVQNDDTTVPVQDHDGKGIKTGRLWVSIGDHDHPYTVYTYTPDRSAAGPREIFRGFRGYLQADAYSAYDGLYTSGAIVEVGCLMHARRKFHEARTSDPRRSHQALAWIRLLYDVEGDVKGHETVDYEAFAALRHRVRAERSRPIFEKFHEWLEAERPKVLPKSPIGEAIQYALNHWEALKRPLEAGFLELDNGACERAFKPVALGRKNWLFAGSDKGGQTAAILMSLCTTCKDLRIDPQAYVRDVLDRISTHPAKRIDELLPDRWRELRRAGDAAPD